MFENLTEFSHELKQLEIQKNELEYLYRLIDSYPEMKEYLKPVLLFNYNLCKQKEELEQIISAPCGTEINPARNIKLLNIDLPKSKEALEMAKCALINYLEINPHNIDFNLIVIEYIFLKENDIFENSIEEILQDNITRINDSIDSLKSIKKNQKSWFKRFFSNF